MRPNLLILGGTTEAMTLARAVQSSGLTATLSLAGRVARPAASAVPQRIGGFGGVAGLADYLRAQKITHLIDATHPFAARMSRNAIDAARETGVPLVALTRPPWTPVTGDRWENVPDMNAAVCALDRPAARVFLGIGRMHLAEFAAQPQHHYLLRLVDEPSGRLPLPNAQAIIARGPFSETEDMRLLQDHEIELVVSKNSGGAGAYAKIAAARQLRLPVVMIDRPTLPHRCEVHSADEVLDWLSHPVTDLGV